MKYAIEIKNLKKYFKIADERGKSIKRAVINSLLFRNNYAYVKAVDGVSLNIKKGEFIGITGRNGSGKSTLLKLIAGVMSQDSGEISVNGKISPFLELGAGFAKELTAMQNIYLYGAILGIHRDEIKQKAEKILEFADLHKFKNAKLGGFSSGMKSRLGFATAMQVDADIFLVDEALAVGDIGFKKKCFDSFEKVKKSGKTIVFVSHHMDSLERFCDRLFLMEQGRIIAVGKPKKIIEQYKLQALQDKGGKIKAKEMRRREIFNGECFP